jgi:SAM-dependent methyltransferase
MERGHRGPRAASFSGGRRLHVEEYFMNQIHDETRSQVRAAYAKVAQGQEGCCGGGCYGTRQNGSLALGYTEEEVASVPEGADLGLGCGSPQAIAALQPGETVLDLGSGAGFDCLLAARGVGREGRVIGVDMTPEMVTKARANAYRVGAANVEFRLGEIEHLPVADGCVDVVLSNCVINLSPNKASVFLEAFRVLKPGGRLAISDVIATAPIPEASAQSMEAFAGCIAGAASAESLRAFLSAAGFQEIQIQPRTDSRAIVGQCMPGAESYLASATIEGRKPGGGACCAPSCCVDENSW